MNWLYQGPLKTIEGSLGSDSDFDGFLKEVRDARFPFDQPFIEGLERLGWEGAILPVNSLLGLHLLSRSRRTKGGTDHLMLWVVWLGHKILGFESLRKRFWGFYAMALIKRMKPDIVYFGYHGIFSSRLLKKIRGYGIRVVLQHSTDIPPVQVLRQCDGFVSCVRWLVAYAEHVHIPALHLRHGFDSRKANDSQEKLRDIDVSFIGSVNPVQHPTTIPLLLEVARTIEGLRIYGPESPLILSNPILKPLYQGEAYGEKMFSVLERSKVTLNRHAIAPGGEAANMRLFEATGSGAALVTDSKLYLEEIFDPGSEVVVYETVGEAATLVKKLLSDEDLRQQIARAGQKRTLSDHTMEKRMEELDVFLRSLLLHD